MRSSLIPLLASALLLVGCSGAATEPTEAPTTPAVEAGETASYPRTITVPAGADSPSYPLTFEAPPTRIAALTYETGELVAHLGAADRLVLVQESLTKETISGFPDLMAAVAHHAPTEGSVDAETVIAAEPDLVLLTPRRGLEQGLAQVLDDAGIAVLTLPNQWATLEETTANIELVGEALGLEEAAGDLSSELTQGLTPSGSAEDSAAHPRVLVLSNQAGQPFVTAGQAFPLEMLRSAGARDAGEELGLVRSGPITAEQVIAVDPDAILLVDMNGSGAAVFDPLLTNAAVAELPAVAEDRVLLMEGRLMQALGFTATIEGHKQLTHWIAEDVAPQTADS